MTSTAKCKAELNHNLSKANMVSRVLTNSLRSSSSSDNTSSSSKSALISIRNFKLHVQDLLIIALGILIAIAVSIVAIVVFFTVQPIDAQRANTALKAAHADALQQISDALQKTHKSLHLLATVVQANPSMDYATNFLPVMDAGIPPYVNLMMYNDRVLSADKNAYIASKRSQGGLYANFTIFTKQGDDAVEYYPVALSNVPRAMEFQVHAGFDRLSEIAFLGSDIYEPASKNAFAYLESEQKASISDSFFSETTVDSNNKTVYKNSSILIMLPVVDTTSGALRGSFSAHYSMDQLIADIVQDNTFNFLVTMYDSNNTALNGGLIYNSYSLSNNEEVVKAQKREMFTVQGNITFLTRVYTLKFTSTASYVISKQGASRWIGVIIGAVVLVCGELLCLSLFIFFRLRKSIRDRLRKKRALHALKDSHERTKLLLSRLAKQEAKSRATVDAIPDFVIILNWTGRIVHTNRTFDKLFGYSHKQLEEGLHITAVMPSFTANIFAEPKYSSDESDVYIRAIASSNTSQDMDVKCIVKNLYKTGMEKTGAVSPLSSVGTPLTLTPTTPILGTTFDEVDEEDEAFAVIGRVIQQDAVESFDLRKKANL